jgi:hypothetical protein
VAESKQSQTLTKIISEAGRLREGTSSLCLMVTSIHKRCHSTATNSHRKYFCKVWFNNCLCNRGLQPPVSLILTDKDYCFKIVYVILLKLSLIPCALSSPP